MLKEQIYFLCQMIMIKSDADLTIFDLVDSKKEKKNALISVKQLFGNQIRVLENLYAIVNNFGQ